MKPILSFLLIFGLSGCINLGTLQSGKVLEKDSYEIVPSLSSAKLEFQTTDYNDALLMDYYPYLAIRYKYGFGERFDMGIYGDISSNLGVTTKYQFLGSQDSYFAASTGLDIGTNIFSLVAMSQNPMLISVPLYISVHPTEYLAIYFTPRYVHNHRYGFINNYPEDRGFLYAYDRSVFTYGVLIGSKNKFAFEISHNGSRVFQPTHLTMGYVFILK